MSGGRLVVLDRHGRDVKCYPLPDGLATLGSDPACDIRVMLPSVSAHHATVVVHANQTVVRNVSDGETLVNGQSVSVAALRHGDVISIGGRSLRWEYSDPTAKRQHKASLELALGVPRRGARGARGGRGGTARPARRATGGAAPSALAREPAVRLALEMTHRASMPGAAGKQVAIVQPQRRDTHEQLDKNQPRTPLQTNKRRSKTDLDTSTNDSESDSSKRKSTARMSPKNVSSLQTTKATLWIESRKTSPRKSAKVQTPPQVLASVRRSMPAAKKSTPLRLTVLKKAQSAQKMRVTKIEAPLKIDHTKQAAIMLMTGHTPKKPPSPKSAKKSPSYVVKKQSPVRKTPAGGGRKSGRRSKENATPTSIGVTPRRASTYSSASRRSSRRLGDQTVTILEITDSDAQNRTARGSNASRRSSQKSPKKSPLLPSPKKSALKDPKAKKSMRKTESIKFDLSNLENHSQSTDVLMLTDTTKRSHEDSASGDELTLRYSDTSSVLSPSPRRSIHSRSSKILEKSLGKTINISPPSAPSRTLTPESPHARKSSRGSIILQKALDKSEDTQTYSRRSSRSSDRSRNLTNGSAYQTRTLNPRSSSRNDLESYSIVDLVSIDSSESGRSTSVYNSAGSTNSTAFGTPQNSLGRKTRSTIDTNLLSSSTPYVKGDRSSTRSQSSENTLNGTSTNLSQVTARSSTSRRSKSLSTPENTEDTKKHITVNSTKISRASKSRSRLNDSDFLLVEGEEHDDSPKSSKRSRGKSSQTSLMRSSKNASLIESPTLNEGGSTPENRHSPVEASTPVLSIQSLLDSSQSSFASYNLQKKGRLSGPSYIAKRKTIGGISEPKTRAGIKSKSMSFTARKTRLRLSSDSVQEIANDDSVQLNDEEIVTPKSAVKLVQEGVKNKHSTAKKPQSKRWIIDDLNESDMVKQLFNSPVKRKLSQSMTEFSRKQLFEDDDIEFVKRPTRNTVAITGRTPDNSLLEHTESFTPERFVSPINTPTKSPNLAGIKRLFDKNTPANDLRNVRGVKALLRTPRTRRSVRNDLSNVSGVKAIFDKSPRNRLSDVQIKEVFASSPKNDLRRVSGVKALFQTEKKYKSPKNDLSDVRGVKKLFKGNKSPANDLRNVSGVKRALQRNSPRNDFTDVRGVKRMFKESKKQDKGLTDISGVEELFNTSSQSYGDSETLFDRLVGRPPIRSVYSKTFSTKLPSKTKTSRKSLHTSLNLITNNVEKWLEKELQTRLHNKNESVTNKSGNRSLSMTRELQKLATDTVEGSRPIRTSRVRNSTLIKSIQTEGNERKKSTSELYSAHTLPIKKRSLLEASVPKASLPLKKRAVLHSTPVKGRADETMSAPELARVSPIALVDHTRAEYDTTVRSTQQFAEQSERPVKSKDRRQTKAKNIEQKVKNIEQAATSSPKPSPKKTRAKAKPPTTKAKPSPAKGRSTRQTKTKADIKKKSTSSDSPKAASPKPRIIVSKATSSKAKSPSPVKPRSTRSRKNVASPEKTVKKRRASIVVGKKTPVMSPKPRATRHQKPIVASPKVTPKKTRATRKVEEKVKTPKNTRTKVQKASVVVSKPSPQIKPQVVKPEPERPKRTRKTADVSSKESPKESRATRATIVPKTRGRRAEITKQESTQSEPVVKRGRKTAAEFKNATDSKDNEKSVVKTRGKIVAQASVQSEPTTRSRRTKLEVAEVKTRKRKAAPEEVVQPKVAKSKDVESRGRKRTVETTEIETVHGRVKRTVVMDSKLEITRQGSGDAANKTSRSVRSKKVVELTIGTEQKQTRGRKTTIVEESAPKVGNRKRKTTVDLSPVKEVGSKQPGGKKSRKIAPPGAPPRAPRRATRPVNPELDVSAVSKKPAGRSRRR